MADPSFFTDGGAYERLMGRWSRAVGEQFLDWLALPKGLDWVDVGCGTGAFTELVVERCAPRRISAIDPAEDQLAFARTRPAAARASFQVGDALSLPFGDREFDAAAMALVISFVPDPQKAVAEMKRVTKPGGTVATYMWDGMGGGFVQQPLLEAVVAMNVDVPMNVSRKNSRIEELQGFFDKAGLDQVSTRTIRITLTYQDFDDYWTSQTAIANPAVQAIRKLSDADVERLKARLRERFSIERGGPIAYPAWANAVKGRAPV